MPDDQSKSQITNQKPADQSKPAKAIRKPILIALQFTVHRLNIQIKICSYRVKDHVA